MKLPDVIPLFPLPNAVLFPGVPLPLHVFEPRYRDMVRDAEKADDPLIGMVLLRGEWRKDYSGSPQIFPVGCAGRMVRVEALEDGRYNILLQGLREFSIERELGGRAFRRAAVTWRSASARVETSLRARISDLMRRFLRGADSHLAKRMVDDASVSDELLVNFLCFALEFSPLEKQALLEAPGLSERAERLCEVVQFALDAGPSPANGERWH